MKIKENLLAFKNDYLRIIIAVTNGILAMSMYVSPEPHNFFFWFTLCFRITTILSALFIGNKALWLLYFIFCNVKALDITYNNYTCVALITVLFALTPKVTIKQAVAVAVLYVTDVFIVAGLHNKSAFYIYNHFLLCSQFVAAMWKQKQINKIHATNLIILTPEEIKILKQLVEGKPIKQVSGFLEPTVYRKLSDARERNKVETNSELIELYKKI